MNETERTLWDAGGNIKSLIRLMRESGLNQPRSIDMLEAVAHVDRGAAQTAVLESETWRDQYERNMLIQDQLAKALFRLSKEGVPGVSVVINEKFTESSVNPEQVLKMTNHDR